MPATVRSVSSAAIDGASIVFNKPAGLATGDILIASVFTDGALTTFTVPTGFLDIRTETNVNGVDNSLRTWYKLITNGPGEPSTYTFTPAVTKEMGGGLVCVQGGATSLPIDISSGAQGINSATVVAASVDTTVADTLLLMFAGVQAIFLTGWSPPGTMTEEWDVCSGGNDDNSNMAASEARAATGATGTRTATAPGSGDWIAQLIAVKSETAAVSSTPKARVVNQALNRAALR